MYLNKRVNKNLYGGNARPENIKHAIKGFISCGFSDCSKKFYDDYNKLDCKLISLMNESTNLQLYELLTKSGGNTRLNILNYPELIPKKVHTFITELVTEFATCPPINNNVTNKDNVLYNLYDIINRYITNYHTNNSNFFIKHTIDLEINDIDKETLDYNNTMETLQLSSELLEEFISNPVYQNCMQKFLDIGLNQDVVSEIFLLLLKRLETYETAICLEYIDEYDEAPYRTSSKIEIASDTGKNYYDKQKKSKFAKNRYRGDVLNLFKSSTDRGFIGQLLLDFTIKDKNTVPTDNDITSNMSSRWNEFINYTTLDYKIINRKYKTGTNIFVGQTLSAINASNPPNIDYCCFKDIGTSGYMYHNTHERKDTNFIVFNTVTVPNVQTILDSTRNSEYRAGPRQYFNGYITTEEIKDFLNLRMLLSENDANREKFMIFINSLLEINIKVDSAELLKRFLKYYLLIIKNFNITNIIVSNIINKYIKTNPLAKLELEDITKIFFYCKTNNCYLKMTSDAIESLGLGPIINSSGMICHYAKHKISKINAKHQYRAKINTIPTDIYGPIIYKDSTLSLINLDFTNLITKKKEPIYLDDNSSICGLKDEAVHFDFHRIYEEREDKQNFIFQNKMLESIKRILYTVLFSVDVKGRFDVEHNQYIIPRKTLLDFQYYNIEREEEFKLTQHDFNKFITRIINDNNNSYDSTYLLCYRDNKIFRTSTKDSRTVKPPQQHHDKHVIISVINKKMSIHSVIDLTIICSIITTNTEIDEDEFNKLVKKHIKLTPNWVYNEESKILTSRQQKIAQGDEKIEQLYYDIQLGKKDPIAMINEYSFDENKKRDEEIKQYIINKKIGATRGTVPTILYALRQVIKTANAQ
jgi:hypothetical protein